MQDELSIAYVAEKSAYKIYEKVSEYCEVFVQIKSIRENGLKLLSDFAKLNKINLQYDDIDIAFIPENLEDILIFVINYENSLCKTYESLTDNTNDEHLKDVFFRLWATCSNEYIPTLKELLKHQISNKSTKDLSDEVLNSDNLQNMFGNYQQEFSQISSQLENILSDKADKKDIMKILNSPNFSFLSGAALGVLGASFIAKNIQEDENNKKD
ncbi:hypothetical protein [Campylobacter pinnipediorum]|uniref:Aminotransferase n=1 Tax=Campylobacter pinnipediorum subsp. pinnipediorum TaxID=1660067 RepID=A0AAX0LBB1_9BACT|nr:hypothetical protein [Campylobacter pinnipediorum]AQW83398.1 hypothetical protein CPIN17261_1401 [Campylobacter pinnipediorum subsp. pinnipediorum]OPA81624.1 hypothetical protein BFG04_00320 [Campylobacter pinnipediorum subsp. pinnipediorum]